MSEFEEEGKESMTAKTARTRVSMSKRVVEEMVHDVRFDEGVFMCLRRTIVM